MNKLKNSALIFLLLLGITSACTLIQNEQPESGEDDFTFAGINLVYHNNTSLLGTSVITVKDKNVNDIVSSIQVSENYYLYSLSELPVQVATNSFSSGQTMKLGVGSFTLSSGLIMNEVGNEDAPISFLVMGLIPTDLDNDNYVIYKSQFPDLYFLVDSRIIPDEQKNQNSVHEEVNVKIYVIGLRNLSQELWLNAAITYAQILEFHNNSFESGLFGRWEIVDFGVENNFSITGEIVFNQDLSFVQTSFDGEDIIPAGKWRLEKEANDLYLSLWGGTGAEEQESRFNFFYDLETELLTIQDQSNGDIRTLIKIEDY
jgi:hypothetical protein